MLGLAPRSKTLFLIRKVLILRVFWRLSEGARRTLIRLGLSWTGHRCWLTLPSSGPQPRAQGQHKQPMKGKRPSKAGYCSHGDDRLRKDLQGLSVTTWLFHLASLFLVRWPSLCGLGLPAQQCDGGSHQEKVSSLSSCLSIPDSSPGGSVLTLQNSHRWIGPPCPIKQGLPGGGEGLPSFCSFSVSCPGLPNSSTPSNFPFPRITQSFSPFRSGSHFLLSFTSGTSVPRKDLFGLNL